MRGRPDLRKPPAQKKHNRGWGVRGMRYPASEKLEIIRTVEGSHLPTKQTLDMLGIPRSTFYRWYDLYLEDGLDGLSDNTKAQLQVPFLRSPELLQTPHHLLSEV